MRITLRIDVKCPELRITRWGSRITSTFLTWLVSNAVKHNHQLCYMAPLKNSFPWTNTNPRRKVYQITSKHLRIDCIVSYFTEEEIHRVVLHAISRDWLCSPESKRSLSNWISVFIVSQDSTLFHSYQFHSLLFLDTLPKHLYPSQSIILSNHSLLSETMWSTLNA